MRARSPVTKVVPAPRQIEDIMGLTHVTVSISNPADRTRNWESLFLVDTGAIDSMAPASALHEIGIVSEGKKTYEMPDGTKVQFEFGLARIEFLGEVSGGIIIFGPDDCEPILGVTALESTGVVVDPKSNQLKRLPAVPLK
jgi:clan AA aspartic protease